MKNASDSKKRHAAVIPVNLDLLGQCLLLPDGAKVVGVFVDEYQYPDCLMIKVTHPDLPQTREGEQLMTVVPYYRATEGLTGGFMDWDIRRAWT